MKSKALRNIKKKVEKKKIEVRSLFNMCETQEEKMLMLQLVRMKKKLFPKFVIDNVLIEKRLIGWEKLKKNSGTAIGS